MWVSECVACAKFALNDGVTLSLTRTRTKQKKGKRTKKYLIENNRLRAYTYPNEKWRWQEQVFQLEWHGTRRGRGDMRQWVEWLNSYLRLEFNYACVWNRKKIIIIKWHIVPPQLYTHTHTPSRPGQIYARRWLAYWIFDATKLRNVTGRWHNGLQDFFVILVILWNTWRRRTFVRGTCVRIPRLCHTRYLFIINESLQLFNGDIIIVGQSMVGTKCIQECTQQHGCNGLRKM